MTPQDLRGPGAHVPGLRVVVAGLGTSGSAAAEALAATGADVTGIDARPPEHLGGRASALPAHGVRLICGPVSQDPDVVAGADLVVASPGWAPHHPVLRAAAAAGVPVWAEAELAWRLRDPAGPAWVCVTGTNGKTTTVGLVAAILTAAGRRAATAGNIGTPLVDAVRDPAVDILAVELSSFQLHGVTTVSALAAACLNVAQDHLDWHGSFEAYAAAKGRIYDRAQRACVFSDADAVTSRLAAAAQTAPGCRRVAITLAAPGPGSLGVVDGRLVDRAFGQPQDQVRDLAGVADVPAPGDGPAPPHLVADALAAAALALAAGVTPDAVARGLRGAAVPGHRGACAGSVAGVRFVDDSKATNPHAAQAALAAVDGAGSGSFVVWIAGGQAKGASFDDLVRRHAGRLRGVVLAGADREVVAAALDRHAPHLPRVRVDPPETGSVTARLDAYGDRLVRAAAGLARPGDTVLLAPGGASLDQFSSYAHRGEVFAAAVARLRAADPA